MEHHQPPRPAWVTLTVIGVLAVVMGLAFVGLRPRIVLLPEDQRYTGLTPDQLRALEPRLFAWMGMVFRSWGAFAIGLGTTVAGLAAFAYRRGEVWAHWLLMIAGLATFSIFLTVNIILRSDFTILIGLLFAAYIGALAYGWFAGLRGRPKP
jgi:hypothetical protein